MIVRDVRGYGDAPVGCRKTAAGTIDCSLDALQVQNNPPAVEPLYPNVQTTASPITVTAEASIFELFFMGATVFTMGWVAYKVIKKRAQSK